MVSEVEENGDENEREKDEDGDVDVDLDAAKEEKDEDNRVDGNIMNDDDANDANADDDGKNAKVRGIRLFRIVIFFGTLKNAKVCETSHDISALCVSIQYWSEISVDKTGS